MKGDIILKIGSTLKEHFSEVLLCIVLLLMLSFAVHMGAVHNDSLASKGMEFAGQVLAALLTLMVGSSRKQSPPEVK